MERYARPILLAVVFSRSRLSALATAALLLAGCGMVGKPPRVGDVADKQITGNPVTAQRDYNEQLRASRGGGQPVMGTPARPGAGVVSDIRLPAGETRGKTDGARRAAAGKAVTLEFFEPESLKKIIELMLKDYLKVPHVFEDNFKDKQVKMYLNAGGTKEDMLQTFDAFLETQGVRLKYLDGVYLVTMDDKSKRLLPSPSGLGETVGILRLKYLDAKDFLPLARQAVKESERLTYVQAINAFVITSSGSEIRVVQRLAADLDVPFFEGKHILIYAPRFLTAKGLIAIIDQYQEQLGSTVARPHRQIEARELPDQERIVVVTPHQAAHDFALELIARSDVPSHQNHRQLFQYSLTTQRAGEILATLKNLIGQVLRGAPAIEPVADKETNSLFVYATAEEYAEIRKLMQRLDARPASVYIDALIAQVSLSNNLKYGVQWFLQNQMGGASALLAGAVAFPGTGPSLTFSLDNTLRTAVLQALAGESDVTVLSTPQIQVKNGYTAKITAATETPISAAKTSGNNLVTSNIEYKKIGVELEVTPSIGNDGDIKLTVIIKDSNITGLNKVDGNDYPITSTRELKTELVAREGSTVFLGGLRKFSKSSTASKIPLLGDLGGPGSLLFRNTNDAAEDSELIVLLTPTLILDAEGAERVTRALVTALKSAPPNPPPGAPPPDRAVPAPVPVPVPAQAAPETVAAPAGGAPPARNP